MLRYSTQFRNTFLRKLLPPESRTAGSLATEYGLSIGTIYGWKAKMNNGTLQVDDSDQSNRHRQLSGKFSLLLESRGIPEDEMGVLVAG